MAPNTTTWADYERLLVTRYTAGGLASEATLHFARGEISAIRTGNHWTHGKPTPADPHALTVAAALVSRTAPDLPHSTLTTRKASP